MSADLILISQCLDGDEAAWEQLVRLQHPHILAFALTLTKDEAAAKDIASTVWADLYGLRSDAQGKRISKLASFSGRGSLTGWLRTLVAQAYVDRYRKERRFVTFDGFDRQAADVSSEYVDPRLQEALDKALDELSAEQRLILSAHFLDSLSFSDIGRMLGLHESSVSRQANRSLNFLRKRTAHHLRVAGMSMHEAQEAMGSDVRSISLDFRRRLQLAKNTP